MDSDESVLIQYAGDRRDLLERSFTVARRKFQRFDGVAVVLRDGARVHRWMMGIRMVEELSDVLYSFGNLPLSDAGKVRRVGRDLEIRSLGLVGGDEDFGRQHMVDVAKSSANGSFVVTVEHPVTVAYLLDRAAFG